MTKTKFIGTEKVLNLFKALFPSTNAKKKFEKI
jgi:hypothetical protein